MALCSQDPGGDSLVSGYDGECQRSGALCLHLPAGDNTVSMDALYLPPLIYPLIACCALLAALFAFIQCLCSDLKHLPYVGLSFSKAVARHTTALICNWIM